jgi:hypothetical protein
MRTHCNLHGSGQYFLPRPAFSEGRLGTFKDVDDDDVQDICSNITPVNFGVRLKIHAIPPALTHAVNDMLRMRATLCCVTLKVVIIVEH